MNQANQAARTISSMSVETNDLGNVVLNINGQVIHMSASEADKMSADLHMKAQDAYWQSNVAS